MNQEEFNIAVEPRVMSYQLPLPQTGEQPSKALLCKTTTSSPRDRSQDARIHFKCLKVPNCTATGICPRYSFMSLQAPTRSLQAADQKPQIIWVGGCSKGPPHHHPILLPSHHNNSACIFGLACISYFSGNLLPCAPSHISIQCHINAINRTQST